MNAGEFLWLTGFAPENDDLERVNCEKAGEMGHHNCGLCPDHVKPRFVCGCWYDKERDDDH